jgi:hypothetical protein
MNARATIVSCSGDHEDAALGTPSDRLRQQRLGFASRAQLPAADIDDMRPGCDRLVDGAGEVKLRTGL